MIPCSHTTKTNETTTAEFLVSCQVAATKRFDGHPLCPDHGMVYFSEHRHDVKVSDLYEDNPAADMSMDQLLANIVSDPDPARRKQMADQLDAVIRGLMHEVANPPTHPDQADRLKRTESMLVYLLETQPATQEVQPTLDQAKALQAMGLPPWKRMTRQTNRYELWRESWERLQAQQAADKESIDGKA